MVQEVAPVVDHDTKVVPVAFTRFGEALIEAETTGSGVALGTYALQEPAQLYEP